jgi:hypothetical protein
MINRCLILIVSVAFFLQLPSVGAAQSDRRATDTEQSTLLRILLKNPVIHAALQEALDAGEKCETKIVSATKPPQFEDGTTFNFEAAINCSPRRERSFVRMIKITGTSFSGILDNLMILIQRAG